MELTADMFKGIVGTHRGGASCGPDDHRRASRTPTRVCATLLPFSDAFSLHAIRVPVRDVSRGGFRFLYDRPVALGESFALVLPETSAPPTVILCTVANWEPLTANLYAIGARFAQVLRHPPAPIELDLEPAPPHVRKAS